MTKPFNQLNPAEVERLAMLAEEASEIAQIAMKIIRHGYQSHNPNDQTQTPNKGLLRIEVADFAAVWEMMVNSKDVDDITARDVELATLKKQRYAHHQKDLI